ncbi:MAG: TonB-dependent receptor [Rhodanobacter sp.]
MSEIIRRTSGNCMIHRKALTLAIGGSIALAAAGGAFAQSITGTIRGTVPAAPDETIQITGGAGFERNISVGSSGRYSITLPVGTYTVTLMRQGVPVQSRKGVTPAAAGAVTINFSATAPADVKTLAAVKVVANAIPPIDVTTTNQVTTITAAQLVRLPLARSAEAVAMLAPGVAMGASSLGTGQLGNPLLSFGGASVAENAYYIDGMNTTDAITGQGGVPLPYGAIEQQQTMTTGYGARYGRSIGGVLSQIGKSGSNEWHFGFKALWQPASLAEGPRNEYWSNPSYTGPNAQETVGNLEQYAENNKQQEAVYDAYISGPLIKDKLTFFLAAEQDNTRGQSTGSVWSPFTTKFQTHQPKLYAKINWNINDSNILSVTAVQNSTKVWPSNYNFDYSTFKNGDFTSLPLATKSVYRLWVANYTSDITDSLTLHAMVGKVRGAYPLVEEPYPGFDPTLPNIAGASSQNPAFIPNGPVSNTQTSQTISDPSHTSVEMNYRLDLEYQWRKHDFRFGIDNLQTWDHDDGAIVTGPGYGWAYGQGDSGTPIVGGNPNLPPYAGSPDSNGANPGGYYVAKVINNLVASTRLTQRAQYVEDRWQVTPDLLLDLGLRNDQFVNDSASGIPFARLTKPQWSPRLGFAWDVHGDSTLKVFGNAGRYYLALPAAVSFNSTATALQTSEYFTYSGIDPATGVPLGLVQIPQNNGGRSGLGVSAFNAYGQPVDAHEAASTNIKPEYSDNFVLGMQQQFHMLGANYVFGADVVYQDMGPNIIDDWDDTAAMCRAAVAQGLTYAGATMDDKLSSCSDVAPGFILINPTQTTNMLIKDGNGALHQIVVTPQDQGFPRKVERKSYAVNLSLEHSFDGKWYGNLVYTWSRSWGNTEGPVDSLAGLSGGGGGGSIALTPQWDAPSLMEYSYGVLPNNHTNALKAYGYYQINPDWRAGGSLYVSSGAPRVCLGQYGPGETDPVGYGSVYHWCAGKPSPMGSLGSMPWFHTVDLNVNYNPAWMHHNWNFNLAVFNVLNDQAPTQLNYSYGTSGTPNPSYLLPQGRRAPRMVRFDMSYDF